MKIMNFIKKHKIALIVVGVCLVLIILLFFAIKNTFFPNMNKSKYGNRLDGIENYPIEESMITDIKNGVLENEVVTNLTYDLKGRIINFIITVKDGTELNVAKEAATKVLEYFNDDYKSFYDIQIFLTCDNAENEIYPKMGYKHKTSSEIKWNVD